MLKRYILPIVMCAAMLCGCEIDMSDGGTPIPTASTSSVCSEGVSTPAWEIKRSDADKLLSELEDIIGQISVGTLYVEDITYMDKVCKYLAQYNTFDTEIAKYMESVRTLLESYCSFYARNIGIDKVEQKIVTYIDEYYALSEEFRAIYSPFDRTKLENIMDKVRIMTELTETSSNG